MQISVLLTPATLEHESSCVVQSNSDTDQHPVSPKVTQTGGNVILSSLVQRSNVLGTITALHNWR